MAGRTRAFLYLSLTSAVLVVSGCSTTQQSRFQTSFLPAAPRPVALSAEITEPPPVKPNLYIQEPSAALNAVTQASAVITRGDTLIQRAEQHYQRGRKFYQTQDVAGARREFDTAVDLMLDASDNRPSDRAAFERRFDQMVDAIHRYDLVGLGSSTTPDEAQFAQTDKAPLEDILQMTFPVDPKMKDKVKEQVRATASQLPLSVNDAVLGYIHYFMGRGHSTLIHGLERAGRYYPMIHRILEEEGIPQELIHLAQAESGFAPRAMSYKAAGGMWQFVAWRGQQYGLMQTKYTDDRFDFEKATRAAAKHLHDLYNEFGDWYLAIAAYNCGPGVVEKAVERTGYADFWELRNRGALPAETTNYVPIILAMTIMDKNAKEYGLEEVTPDPPLEYDSIKAAAATHLALVSDLTDTPISQLMELNPALLKGVAPAGYTVRVPKNSGGTLTASLQMIPAERRASWRMHTVTSGETLAAIGKRYGTAPSNIVAANQMDSADPVAGQRLIIPAAYVEKAPARRSAAKSASKSASRRGAKTAHSSARTGSARTGAKRATVASSTSRKRASTSASKRTRKGPAVLTHTAYNGRERSGAGN
jgi:membrane-bound lytic murein transglycosylase D